MKVWTSSLLLIPLGKSHTSQGRGGYSRGMAEETRRKEEEMLILE